MLGESTFAVLTPAVAAEAIGELSPDDARYLKDSDT